MYKVEQRVQANIVHVEGQEYFFFFGFFPSSEFPGHLPSGPTTMTLSPHLFQFPFGSL